MLELPHVPALQDEYTALWHANPDAGEEIGLDALIVEQHRQNFLLWHQEDRARAPRATAEQIAEVKRTIDSINQRRNDLVEALDLELLRLLADNGVRCGGELHSETPGMIIDRLSILSLKIFHTVEQLQRSEVSPEHLARNRKRHNILLQQRGDLAGCLTALWREVQAGQRQFKLYRQLKMYNDPELNPEIYGAGKSFAQ